MARNPFVYVTVCVALIVGLAAILFATRHSRQDAVLQDRSRVVWNVDSGTPAPDLFLFAMFPVGGETRGIERMLLNSRGEIADGRDFFVALDENGDEHRVPKSSVGFDVSILRLPNLVGAFNAMAASRTSQSQFASATFEAAVNEEGMQCTLTVTTRSGSQHVFMYDILEGSPLAKRWTVR